MSSDVPSPLEFVEPDEIDDTYRVCLWAAPGSGKSVAAASAPAPILVLSADRPSAYRFARKHHSGKDIREVRYVDGSTLTAVKAYLASDEGADIKTLVIDPFSNIYDRAVDNAPARSDGEPNYQLVNKALLRFLTDLRQFGINVVVVAHEKLSDGKKGDGKLYPSLGGPALINKILAEMDIVARIERVEVTVEGKEEPEARWIGQIQPRGNHVCKDATGALGDRRYADLTRWFQLASEALTPDTSDVPFLEPVTEPESTTTQQKDESEPDEGQPELPAAA